VVKRESVLLVDNSDDSAKAVDLLKRLGIEYIKYDIRKFEEILLILILNRKVHIGER
jgi:hypothetical protein